MFFRGTTYAFPISLWVPQEYPNVGPVGFVTPTKDMAVRPGQYVSGEGRIYHPYLAGWRDDVSCVCKDSCTGSLIKPKLYNSIGDSG